LATQFGYEVLPLGCYAAIVEGGRDKPTRDMRSANDQGLESVVMVITERPSYLV
jgi:hypothetical protein